MANKLINQKTFYPEWHAYNAEGKYVGRIEKDQYGVWYLYNASGRNLGMQETFAEARKEATDYLK